VLESGQLERALADHRQLGIFYGMPLLGPSIGPLLGGALGSQYGWRSAFYFLSAFAGLVAIMFIFFPDTWRKEVSFCLTTLFEFVQLTGGLIAVAGIREGDGGRGQAGVAPRRGSRA